MSRFSPHTSGILIGQSSFIPKWKPERFKEAKAQYNLNILRQWQKTFEAIRESELIEV